jgi:hypothetical protein
VEDQKEFPTRGVKYGGIGRMESKLNSFVIRKYKIAPKLLWSSSFLSVGWMLNFNCAVFGMVPNNEFLETAVVLMACSIVLFLGSCILERFKNRGPVYYAIYEVLREKLIINYACNHEVMNFVLEKKDLESEGRRFRVVEINESRTPEKREKTTEAEGKDDKKALKEIDREFPGRKNEIAYKGLWTSSFLSACWMLNFTYAVFGIVPGNEFLEIVGVLMACSIVLFLGSCILERFKNRGPVYYAIYEVFGEGAEKEEKLLINYAYNHEVMNFVLEKKDLESEGRKFRVVKINESRTPEKKNDRNGRQRL